MCTHRDETVKTFKTVTPFGSNSATLYLEMVVAVLQVCAEGRQQLDAVGGDVFGAPLLEVGEAYAFISLGLKKKHL